MTLSAFYKDSLNPIEFFESAASDTTVAREVANAMLGFDKRRRRQAHGDVGVHVFDERLYVAGRLGGLDGYEQPYHSLDLTYSWFPTESLTVKGKLRNILDGMVEIEREGVVVFSARPGTARRSA